MTDLLKTKIEGLKRTNMSASGKLDAEVIPYSSTISVLSSIKRVTSLPRFMEALKYAWSKIQTEVERYWHGKSQARTLSKAKTLLSEDARLMISAYALA